MLEAARSAYLCLPLHCPGGGWLPGSLGELCQTYLLLASEADVQVTKILRSPNDYKIFVSVTQAQRSCLVIGYSGTLRQDECCSSLRQYCSTRGLSCQPAWSRQDSIEKIHSELLDDRYRL